MEIKEIQEAIETASKAIKEKAEGAASQAADALEKAKSLLDDMGKKASTEDLEKAKSELEEKIKGLQTQADKLSAKVNSPEFKKADGEKFNFKSAFGDGLEPKAKELASYAGSKSKLDTSFEMKAVGDMSLANFADGSYTNLTTDFRQQVYQSPFAPYWLRNVLPNISTDKGSIQYVRENGGEGAAALWDPTPVGGVRPDKPQVDFDFTKVTEDIEWIPAIARVPREMLDDASFLRSYIPNELLYGRRGIFVAENAFIINKLSTNSTAYDGTKTVPVERIYDAAFGQIRDNYFMATHILMNHRDAVNYIALNKAVGSGEYDLPVGTVVVINGQLTIGGVPVIGVPNLPSGEFMVIDNRVTQFVSRLSPEVRVFEEDRDNVIKNLVTFRAEERMGVLVLDTLGIISGDLEEA